MNPSKTWGAYAPQFQLKVLRLLTCSGLSHGKVTKQIIKLWKKQHGDLVDISIDNIRYRLNLSDNLTDAKILASSKRYDHKELRALTRACRQGVFVDIGANIGYYSLRVAAGGAASVLAIEPNPPTLERLRFNISINKFDDRITVAPIGIGPSGTANFFSTGDLGSASLIKSASDRSSAIVIQTRPLLDIINENGIERIAGMKIDVEGIEDRALLPFFEAAAKPLWPSCLVIEHCHHQEWETDIIEYLLENGYRSVNKTRANTILKLG